MVPPLVANQFQKDKKDELFNTIIYNTVLDIMVNQIDHLRRAKTKIMECFLNKINPHNSTEGFLKFNREK